MNVVQPFIIGSLFTLGVLLYWVVIDRYLNLSKRFEETRRERLQRVLQPIAWHRIGLSSIIGGLLGVVLWNGVGDVLSVIL